MKQAPLLSLLIPSRRIAQLEGLLESLLATMSDPSRIHILVKYDDDQPEFEALLTRFRDERGLKLEWITSPRLFGAFTMWILLQLMWKRVPRDAYFVLAVTDEARFLVPGFDDLLESHRGFFPDDIFRLRLSISRYRNYYNINQTVYVPDCFPVFTRRWLELTDGFGDCWGSDAFQQSVAYHLGRGTRPFWLHYPENAHFRDLILHGKLLGGIDDFGQDLESNEADTRLHLKYAEWRRMVSHAAQTQHCRLARRILLAIEAHERGLSDACIHENRARKKLMLVNRQGECVRAVSYRVPRWWTGCALLQFRLTEFIMLEPGRSIRKKITRRLSAFRAARAAGKPREAAPCTPAAGTKGFSLAADTRIHVQHGALFREENGRLIPTRRLLRRLERSGHVTCDAETLNLWLARAFEKE